MTFELRQFHRAKPQAPEIPCRVKEVEVGAQCRRRNGSRHPIAGFEQRPVERLAVERDQHRTLCQPLGKRREQRTLFAVLAHEQLLDLKPPAFPPCETDQKWIRSCPAGESRCLRVEKKPLLSVRDIFWSIRCEQPQCRSIWSARGVVAMPTVQ